jgi:hypothetical protein
MRVKIDALPKGLDAGHDTRDKFCASDCVEVFEEGTDSGIAELPKKPALILEEDAQHLGDDKDDLAVGNIQEQCLPHPFAPLLQAFGMTGGAKTSRPAGKAEKILRAT